MRETQREKGEATANGDTHVLPQRCFSTMKVERCFDVLATPHACSSTDVSEQRVAYSLPICQH